MKRPLWMWMLIVIPVMIGPHCFARITADEALSKFVAADIAYKNGKYEEAIARYSEILEGGRESGAVYYNLGNSYFRKGDIGKAVLNYERAKRLIPRDSDLNFNVRYAHSRMERYAGEENMGMIGRAVRGFVDFYTLDELVFIVTGVVFTIGAVFLAALYLNWSGPFIRSVIVILSIVLLIYSAGLIFKVGDNQGLAVVLTKTESYFEPKEDSTIHFRLSEGTKIRILRAEGHWAKVQRADGKSGWISADALEKI